MTSPNGKKNAAVKFTKAKPASFLFWKIQSELSKTEGQLAKLQEDIKAVQDKIEQKAQEDIKKV